MRHLPEEAIEPLLEEQLPPRQNLARNVRVRTKDGALLIDYWLSVLTNERESTKNRLKASELLAQRGWGKPSESVDVTVQAGGNRPLHELPTPLLRALAEVPEDQLVEAVYRILPDYESVAAESVEEGAVTEAETN